MGLVQVWRPELFQSERALRRLLRRGGAGRGGGAFEGWFFKVASGDRAWAFIPGVSMAGAASHAFVQVNGPDGSRQERYPVDAFQWASRPFSVAVAGSRFSLESVQVVLAGFEARLRLSSLFRWPSSPLSPGSMGPYGFARFMECYHGVIALDGAAEGEIDGARIRDGRFYLEKDWGRSFPQAWVWMQSNSFGRAASFTCSLATVPLRRRSFAGLIIGLLADRRLHRFATYNGAAVTDLRIDAEAVILEVRRRGLRLLVEAAAARGAELASPIEGAMEGRIRESLAATLTVRLEDGGRTVFAGTGVNAGLEVVNPAALRERWKAGR